MDTNITVYFGDFVLDPSKRQLLRDDKEIKLQPKAFDTLHRLINGAGDVVTKEELLADIWAGSVVTENALTRAISAIRKALNDAPEQSAYIKSVPRIGYRFVANVTQEKSEPAAATLTILPFHSLDRDRRNESLEYGMADTLISQLSRQSALIVRPFSSVRPFYGSDRSPDETMEFFDTDFLLEGSIQHAGDHIRISASLYDRNKNRAVWTDQFVEQFAHIFEMQDRICERIRKELVPHLGEAVGAQVQTKPEAYRSYLEGRLFLGRAVPADAERAIERFERAIDEDPAYAPAWAGIADAYDYLGSTGQDPHTHFESARRAARRALALDSGLPEAKGVLAKVAWQFDLDWPGAQQFFEDAIAQHPNHSGLHIAYSDGCCFWGDASLGVEHARAALAIDPISPWVNTLLAQALYMNGQNEDALAQINHTLELVPDFAFALFYAGLINFAGGQQDAGIAFVERAIASGRDDFVAALGFLYGLSGRREPAEALVKQFTGVPDVPPIVIATIQLGLDNLDEAVAGFERCVDMKIWHVLLLGADPLMKRKSNQPQFQALLKRIGFY